MTNPREVEIAEEAIRILQVAEQQVIEEIRGQDGCDNLDFHRVSLLSGAIAHQRQRSSFFRFEGYFGRSRSS